jgi:hypothetical protein
VPNSWPHHIGDSCSTPFKVKSYVDSTKTGLIDWGSRPNGCDDDKYEFVKVESSNFEVITLGGKEVLIEPTPAIHRVYNPSSSAPYQIIAELKNKKIAVEFGMVTISLRTSRSQFRSQAIPLPILRSLTLSCLMRF